MNLLTKNSYNIELVNKYIKDNLNKVDKRQHHFHTLIVLIKHRCYVDLDTVLSEQGSDRRILSDALHRRPGVVKNEQASSHLTRRM
jgi:hypothetical protein